MSNKEYWEQLHSNKRFRPRYPETEVVRWLMKKEWGETSKVLDAGCGAGRHIKLLAENGIIPYGIDYSSGGVEYSRRLLSESGYQQYVENIIQGSCDSLPYEDCIFDGVISFGVLYYLDSEMIPKAVCEIHRVLKNGGEAIVVVRNTEDYRNNKTPEKCADSVISVNNGNLSGSAERGMVEHFFSKSEVLELFNCFREISVERIVRTYDNETICDNDFIIIAKK